MQKLRVGVIGLGFIGRAHIDALRRVPGVHVTAVAGPGPDRTRCEAQELDIPTVCGDYRELLADPAIDAVHNCTPNNLHFEVNRAAIAAGKACFAEKPLTLTSTEAMELVALARGKSVPAAVNFNHRGFPQVQHARAMLGSGQLGDVYAVHGSYLQDWLLFDTDWNWRLDPAVGGASRAVADIGSHWMDLAQHVTGALIVEVMAELSTVVPVRYRPPSRLETFYGVVDHQARGSAVAIQTEDVASVLLRFGNEARGAFTVSQVSAGRKNRLTFEIDAARGALAWDSEDSERLWQGSRAEPARLGQREPSPALMSDISRLPAGHAEGWYDALRTVIAGFYKQLRGESAPWVATWEDGLRSVALTEAILASSRSQSWVRLGEEAPVLGSADVVARS